LQRILVEQRQQAKVEIKLAEVTGVKGSASQSKKPNGGR
jgi:hypothetical protein